MACHNQYMTTTTATATFDTAAAEIIWNVMDTAQRAAWITNLQAHLDEVPTDQADAMAEFFATKLAS